MDASEGLQGIVTLALFHGIEMTPDTTYRVLVVQPGGTSAVVATDVTIRTAERLLRMLQQERHYEKLRVERQPRHSEQTAADTPHLPGATA